MAWYNVDHYDSDRERHNYCGNCYAQIPKFLIRDESKINTLNWQDGVLTCEGCEKQFAQCGQTMQIETKTIFQCQLEAHHSGEHQSTLRWTA